MHRVEALSVKGIQPMQVETFMLHDDGRVPNNSELALVLYRDAIAPDAATSDVIRLFARNGWRGAWSTASIPTITIMRGRTKCWRTSGPRSRFSSAARAAQSCASGLETSSSFRREAGTAGYRAVATW